MFVLGYDSQITTVIPPSESTVLDVKAGLAYKTQVLSWVSTNLTISNIP